MKLFICNLILFFIFISNSYSCEGYDSETGAYIEGDCYGGDFEGYNTETGSYVYGECNGGDLEAYDSNTNAYVYGDC